MPEEISAAEIAGFRGEVDRLVAIDGSSFSGWLLSLVPQEGRYHGNGDRESVAQSSGLFAIGWRLATAPGRRSSPRDAAKWAETSATK